MKATHDIGIVVIGGSAGSIPVITDVLQSLPKPFSGTVILVVHRSKNTPSELYKLFLNIDESLLVCEPNDKDPVRSGYVYLAPQNYHLLIESDETFSLDYSEPVHYSRPSIDVTFESVARVYTNRVTAILLSGANRDGADGLERILLTGGAGIIQEPATADYPAMPQAAAEQNPGVRILTPDQIKTYLQTILQPIEK
ncbi:chemotaxis protein CheB [Spirosoma sp. HMF4905]|uniref:protein-glutamate methylesterase n=1 Tax=Spirosoma arboris TaxID=2682092 RepID=A0A7K1SLW4_9BACT|nr:chemotaxis protein CheB [Spirosoma arboris]MVM34799.1 chemotaxis protein CheB [Spirosoma arboris]